MDAMWVRHVIGATGGASGRSHSIGGRRPGAHRSQDLQDGADDQQDDPNRLEDPDPVR